MESHHNRILGVLKGSYSREFLESYKEFVSSLVEVCHDPVMPMEL